MKSSRDGGNRNKAEFDDIQLHDAPDSPLTNEASNYPAKGSPSPSLLAASAAEREAAGQGTSGAERLLIDIRDLLQTNMRMMARLRQEKDENQRMMNDWIVAAAVIDRISFILITILFVVGTVALVVISIILNN